MGGEEDAYKEVMKRLLGEQHFTLANFLTLVLAGQPVKTNVILKENTAKR